MHAFSGLVYLFIFKLFQSQRLCVAGSDRPLWEETGEPNKQYFTPGLSKCAKWEIL